MAGAAGRREMLAQKGRLLYERSCEAGGCAESFALHHLERGEAEVVADFLAYLECQAEVLRGDDPEGRLGATLALISRVRGRMEGWIPPEARAPAPPIGPVHRP